MAYDQAEATDFFHGQPHPMWADAREQGSVMQIDGLDMGQPGRESYHVIGWADAEHVLRDPETFSSSINMEHIGEFMGELIVGLDGDEHRKYRNLVAKAFRQSQLDKWDDALVRPIIGKLVDSIARNGRGDLVRDITVKYPVQVICGIVGVPLEDAEQFADWAIKINTGPLNRSTGFAAKKAMTDYLRPLVEDRRANPCGDFLSDLVHAEVDGHGLEEERLWGFLRLLLPAGAETTYRVMGNALYALLAHDGLMARVQADLSLLPAVIEETLRWESSVTMVSRVAAKDTEVGGCPIAKGSPVNVVTAAANHDPRHFDRAPEFDVDRPPALHLAFGTGPHQCLGMHLARLELRAGLETILVGLPNLRFDPDDAGPPAKVEGFAFRGPNRLPVVWDTP